MNQKWGDDCIDKGLSGDIPSAENVSFGGGGAWKPCFLCVIYHGIDLHFFRVALEKEGSVYWYPYDIIFKTCVGGQNKTMKKLMLYVSVILLVMIVAVGYHFSFPVKDDFSNLETGIDEWLNRGQSAAYAHNITLYDSVTLGNLTYIPMEVNEEIGYVFLKRSVTGRYKISHSSHGSGSFRNGIVENGDQKYLLLMGRNTFGNIAKVKFTLDTNHEYEIDVPNQRVFLVYAEVDNDIQTGPVSLDKITLYNAEGREVTSEFDLSGGSIQ